MSRGIPEKRDCSEFQGNKSITMRLRITFAKTEAMRYTSHLDLHRTWERTIRRAGLPLSYSQGFNPRPKINLAAALPLGFTSNCEFLEIWLDEDAPESILIEKLENAVPPGIKIYKIENIDPKADKLPNLVCCADYQITLLDPVTNLAERIDKILESKTLIRERRGKEYNLRPLVESIELQSSAPDEQSFTLRLTARAGATGRPDEVLDEMGIPFNNTRVIRTRLHLK